MGQTVFSSWPGYVVPQVLAEESGVFGWDDVLRK